LTTDTATIGPTGGALTHADGVKITVPVGALADAVTLRVARDTTGMNAALLGVAPDPAQSVDLSPTYAMTPHGTRFAQPVELRIPLDKVAATGPGMLAVLRTEPGRGSWELIPVAKVENGAAVVAITGFSFYKAVRVILIPQQLPSLPPAPPLLEMSASFDGVGPETYTIPGYSAFSHEYRRLYGEITSSSQNLRYAGHVVGLPASCATIRLGGMAGFPSSPRAEDSRGGIGPMGNVAEPLFAQVNATVGTSVVNGVTRPTLDFAFDLNLANAPYKRSVFEELRATNKTGPTPTVAVSFNAYADCGTPVDLGGGNIITTWKIIPGITQLPTDPGWPDQVWFDDLHWAWNTVLYKLDYLPQGYITHPSDVTVAAGASASFSTSAWPTPVGEQRIEWWRSNNDGAGWSRVRTSIVPVSDTADTYTLPSVAATDHNALFRARLCTVPRQASVAESCTDGIAARLSVIQGVAAANFVQQPRALLVRTGQTASLDVQVAGTPTPTLRWQTRPANSNAAWADVSDGTGATTANYSTAALSLSDNGLQLRAVANNLAGDMPSVSVTVSVSDIDVAPSISTQPASISIPAGGDAVFAVAAHGTEALSYQWRRDGTPITGANAPVLKLSAVSAGDASGYSVQISNAAGNLTSDTATLAVTSGAPAAVAPTIVTQPVPVLINAGNTATFAVGVSGTGPFTYQWLKGGQPISAATAAFYSIASAAVGDAGSYSVRVTNSVNTATSSNASLTVNANPVISAVSITSQPSQQIQLPGGSATFAVAASGTGPLSYQWLKDDIAIPGATGAVLLLDSVSSNDAASYSVTVGNALGSLTSTAASLTVVGAPAIATQPAAVSVSEGSTANFSVGVSGNALGYQWTRNNVAISGATSGTYTTTTLTTADNGAVYGVIVYNGAGIVISSGATLSVSPATFSGPMLAAGKLAAAFQHTCAITIANAVACWGYNSSGQIGSGSFSNQPTPYTWVLPEAVDSVATGASGTCVVTVSGAVYCAGTTGSNTSPTLVSGLGTIKQVTLGSAHVCALGTGGGVWCWGNGISGQLGNGAAASSSTPVAVSGPTGVLTGVASIDAGDFHTCARTLVGNVLCWGGNGSLQAGVAGGGNLTTATPMAGLAASQLALGANHSCALLADASVSCWGLALDSTGSTSASPIGVSRLSTITLALGSGSAMVCALDDASFVRCWGTGMMGNGNVNETRPGAALVSGLTGVTALAGGNGHTCALKSDGTLVCWGSNGSFQLGIGDSFARTIPTDVTLTGGFWHP
jgi:alpha-tubulin suppressor-like RCC1 family protein